MINAAANYWSYGTVTKATAVVYAVPISIWALGAIEGIVHTAFYFLKCVFGRITWKAVVSKETSVFSYHVAYYKASKISWDYFLWNGKMTMNCLFRVLVSTIPIFGTYLGIRTFQAKTYERIGGCGLFYMAAMTPQIPDFDELLADYFFRIKSAFVASSLEQEGSFFSRLPRRMAIVETEDIMERYYILSGLSKIYEVVIKPNNLVIIS